MPTPSTRYLPRASADFDFDVGSPAVTEAATTRSATVKTATVTCFVLMGSPWVLVGRSLDVDGAFHFTEPTWGLSGS